ncbi:Pleckstrin homology domain-containing protein [Lipomyces japonicus]|uniref:Pleckstrin homology domain-containing protein n=1 Tax=Lipomyces japonicus TaxID=56871 RepID=UPI0034CF96D7
MSRSLSYLPTEINQVGNQHQSYSHYANNYRFTSFRLSHATPDHIHATSRTVLIGPIPSEWLRRHQKLWLARVSRVGDAEFKAAWSSTFPDSEIPVPSARSSVPITIRRDPGTVASSKAAVRLASSVGKPGTASLRSTRRLSFSAQSDTASKKHDKVTIQSGRTTNSKKLEPSPFRSIAGPSRGSSNYQDPESQSLLSVDSSAIARPIEQQPTPFTRYNGENQYVDMSHSYSRGRNVNRFGSDAGSVFQSLVFAPSSVASTQSFATARGSSAVPSLDISYRDRSLSPTSSRRSFSQGSDTSTIRPVYTVPIRAVSSVSIDTPDTNNDVLGIIPQFHFAEPNAARLSLATLLEQDDQNRQKQDYNSSARQRLKNRRHGNDTDSNSHGSHDSEDESIRNLDFNFLPEMQSHEQDERTRVRNSLDDTVGFDVTNTEGLEKGQVVKIDRMLIGIKSANVPNLPSDFNDGTHVHMNVLEKAREYIAVVRYTGDSAIPFLMQLYKCLTVPFVALEKTPVSLSHTILLDRASVNMNLFSSLDKSLVLWQTDSVGKKVLEKTKVFIMRLRNASLSLEWYGFLRSMLGAKPSRDLIIQVPELEATVKIVIPLSSDYSIQSHTTEIPGDLGENREEEHSVKILDYIIGTALNILDRIPEYKDTIKYWRESHTVGLAIRRYDRIEWLYDFNEEHLYATRSLRNIYGLELRQKVHYPTRAPNPTNSTATLVEPPSIEGFLIRLTQHSGNQTHLGRLFYKQFYFMTHDNLLVFCSPHHANPPAFEKPFSLTDSSGNRKFIHEFTPYPLKDDSIEWLDNSRIRDEQKLRELDNIALSEAYRKLYQMLTSAGVINICDVTEIRKVERNENIDSEIGVGAGPNFNRNGPNESSQYEDGTVNEFDDDRVLELILRSGLVVRLQAFNRITRDEWIARLEALKVYWKARIEADAKAMTAVKADNFAQLHIDDETESQLGESLSKWESLRGIADPKIYNVCPLGFCRSITMKGSLFFKFRKASTFQPTYVIICHGHLLLFEDHVRSATGTEVPKIYHKKREVISLKECYVYSGILTEQDLLSHANSYAVVGGAPGMYTLPRLYADGTTASDGEYSRCFVIWRASKQASLAGKDLQKTFKSQHKKNTGNGTFYSADTLGTAGRGLIFMARSRMEKELWVSTLMQEVGRIHDDSIKFTS